MNNTYTSIESFKQLYETVKHYHPDSMPTLSFTGTVKLHGCNTGIIKTTDGEILTQSKNRLITPDDDHYGFSKFIHDIPKEYILSLFDTLPNANLCIYGEWIGPGIHKNCAINKLKTKQFVIFSVKNLDTDHYIYPDSIQTNSHDIYHINQVEPFHITIDFNNPGEANELLTNMTLQVENQCPWGEKFGCEGIGEGIVWSCNDYPHHPRFMFKTKGEKHSNKKQRTVAPIDHELVSNINQCVDYILGEARLDQGLEYLKEMNIPLTMKGIGEYLKWINTDCIKEDMDVIEESGLEWKDVCKEITNRAKKFYIDSISDW